MNFAINHYTKYITKKKEEIYGTGKSRIDCLTKRG